MRHESKMHTYLYVVSGQKVAQLKFRGLAFVDLIELEGAMTPNSEKKRSTSTAVAFRIWPAPTPSMPSDALGPVAQFTVKVVYPILNPKP